MIKIKDNDFLLTDYGLIVCDGVDYTIDDFINSINYSENNIGSFEYSKEEKCFIIRQKDKKIPTRLKLSFLHTKKMEFGYIDPEVQKFMDLVKKFEYEERKEKIVKKVFETGSFPTNKDDLDIYIKYLREEISNTKAQILASSVGLAIPVVSAGVTFLLGKVGFNADSFLIGAGGIVTGSFTLLFTCVSFNVIYLGVEESPSAFAMIKENLDKLKTLEIKRKAVDDYLNGKEPLMVKSDDQEKNKEDEQPYESQFLNVIAETRLMIEQIPSEQRKSYAKRLVTLMEEYNSRLETLAQNGAKKNEFGGDNSVYHIDMSLFPTLLKIYSDVYFVLDEYKKVNGVLFDAKKEQAKLDGLIPEEKQVKEYNTFSEELDFGSGGVAYAVPEGATLKGASH